MWKYPDQVLEWTLELGHYDKGLFSFHLSTPELTDVFFFLSRTDDVNCLKVNNLEPIDILPSVTQVASLRF